VTAVQNVVRATGRSGALRALIDMAAEMGWDVGLYDVTGNALAPAEGLRGLPKLDVQMPLVSPVSHRAAVRSLGEVTGHVVVQPRTDGAVGGWSLAARVADVLGDLCRLEVELEDLAREIAGAYEELNLFYDLSGSLAGARDASVVCHAVLERALRVVPARAARILLSDPDGGLRAVAQWGGQGDESGVGVLSAARVCADSRQHVLLGLDAALGTSTLDEWEEAAHRSLIAVPVRTFSSERVTVIGVLELRDRIDTSAGRPPAFSAGDVKLVQALADQAALLLENTRLASYEREVQLASNIQQALLPAEPPRVAGLDIAARCVAAHDVGGDYYDFLEFSGDRLGLLVADVSAATRATFRAAALRGADPAEMLATGNAALTQDLERSGHFLTAWVARIDPRTGELEFEGAGHPPALLVRADSGVVERHAGGGLPVGVEPGADYRIHRAVLNPGDVLLLYTDGLLEARDADDVAFGEERLIAALRAGASAGAEQVVDGILAAIRAHTSVQSDDRTLVALKRSRPDTR